MVFTLMKTLWIILVAFQVYITMLRTEHSFKTIRGFITTFRPTKTTSIHYNEAFKNFDIPFGKSSKNVFKRFQELANMADLNNFVLRCMKLTDRHKLRQQKRTTHSKIFVFILELVFLFAIGFKWNYIKYLEIPELILQHSLITGHGSYLFISYDEAEKTSKKSGDKIHTVRQRLVILFSWLSCISAVFTSTSSVVISNKPHLVHLVTVYLIISVLVSYWTCQQMKGSLIYFNTQLDLARVCFLQQISTIVSCRIRRKKDDNISSTSYCLNHDIDISKRAIVVQIKPTKAKCIYPKVTQEYVHINSTVVFDTTDLQRPIHCTEDTMVKTNVCLSDQIRCKPLVDFVSSPTATQIRLSTSDLVLEYTDTFKRSENNEKKTVNFESSPIISTLPDCFFGFGRDLFFHLYYRGIMKYQLMRLRTFQTAVPYSVIRLAEKGFFNLGGKVQCFSCSKIHDDYDRINSVETAHHPNCRMALGTEYTNKLINDDTSREMFREIEIAVDKQDNTYSDIQYKMYAEPRGLAIIINNEIFNGDMENRTGTHKDGDKLKEICNNLKFKVMYYVNKTAADIIQIARDIAQRNHTTYDCVVFCIMTHGGYGVLYGTDCVPVEIQKLINFFRSSHCPTLAGKPKIFVFQACQGINNQTGQQLSQDSSDIDADTRKDIIADEADILICFSTVSGSVSYRCPQNGTWFINSLVKNLRLYSKSYDLLTILVIVNNDVGEKSFPEGSNIYKQIPMQKCSLRKLVFLS